MMNRTKPGERETVGIASIGSYIPPGTITSEEIARLSGIPAEVFIEKIGMERKHVAAEDEHPSEMGIRAAKEAVERAGIEGSTTTGSGLLPPGSRRRWGPTAATPSR